MPVEDLLDKPIAFHRCLVTLTNSVNAAVMLSQAIYWSKVAKDRDGWFYKSCKDWEDETGLSRREQDTCRKILREKNFWSEDLRGVPATVHYRVDRTLVISSLAESAKLSLPESAKLDCTKAPNLIGGNRQTIKTENTREYTETTVKPSSALASAPLPSDEKLREPLVGFKQFISIYPSHRRGDKSDAEARRAWNQVHPSNSEANLMLQAALELSESLDWTKERGKFVPNPAKFITEWRRYRDRVKPNHKSECERALQCFREITDQPESVNSMTAARREMFSDRWDDALRMAKGGDTKVAIELIESAIQACADEPRHKKHLDTMKWEDVFRSTERFETLVKEAGWLA